MCIWRAEAKNHRLAASAADAEGKCHTALGYTLHDNVVVGNKDYL